MGRARRVIRVLAACTLVPGLLLAMTFIGVLPSSAAARRHAATAGRLPQHACSQGSSVECPVNGGRKAKTYGDAAIWATNVNGVVTLSAQLDDGGCLTTCLFPRAACVSVRGFHRARASDCGGGGMMPLEIKGPGGDPMQSSGSVVLPRSFTSKLRRHRVFLQVEAVGELCTPGCGSGRPAYPGWRCGPVKGCSDYYGSVAVRIPKPTTSSGLPVGAVGEVGFAGLIVAPLGLAQWSVRRRRRNGRARRAVTLTTPGAP